MFRFLGQNNKTLFSLIELKSIQIRKATETLSGSLFKIIKATLYLHENQ